MSRARILVFISLLLLVGAGTAVPARAAQPTSTYLVGFKSGIRASSLTRAGVEVRQIWTGLHVADVQTDAAGAAALRSNPTVSYVEADGTLKALSTTRASTSDQVPWGIQAIGAPTVWSQGDTGTGIKVCVLDTGIDLRHPDFQNGVIKGSKNFVPDGHTTAMDGDGHGTHVAGTIAAHLDGVGVVGGAYGVQLYVARVLDNDGEGSTSSLVNAVNWCVNTVHTRILNLSFGSDRSSATLRRLFDSAYAKGVLSFAASGNDGQDGVGYPAGYSSVIAVGATDEQSSLADFSNYGTKQELVAPGVDILSTYPVGTGLNVSTTEDGTSYQAVALEYSGTGSVSGRLVDCGTADTTTSCASPPSDGTWIAFIKRGSVSFADKLKNVMAQGASAAIVANNDAVNPYDASGFTLGSEGTWIPAAAVSYKTAAAIQAQGLGVAQVTVAPWDYAYEDGTSMSTPHAVAAAALAWAANPKLSNKQIRKILQKSAKDLGKPGRDSLFGYGLVQANKAVTLARATKP